MIKTVFINCGPNIDVDLLPCPFCGGDPMVIHKGNNYSRSQSIIIKCQGCRIVRTDSVMTHPIEWILPKAVASWNRRHTKDPANEA